MVFGFGAPCPKIHTTFLFSKHVSKVFENIFKIKLKVKKRSELHTFTVPTVKSGNFVMCG